MGLVEERRGRAQDIVARRRAEGGAPLLFKVFDTLGHLDIAFVGAVEVEQEVLELVIIKILDELENMLDRGARTEPGLGGHLSSSVFFSFSYNFYSLVPDISRVCYCSDNSYMVRPVRIEWY